MSYPSDMFHYMSKAESFILISLKAPPGCSLMLPLEQAIPLAQNAVHHFSGGLVLEEAQHLL